jgi:HD-GYP domain-containing protein (c-di-GMP phosphodiesterase class II)
MTKVLQQSLDASEVLVIPGLEEDQGYGPLPLRNLVVGREVPFDVFLKAKQKGEKRPSFVKGCPRGEVFREDWHQKLLQLQIPCVYFSLVEMEQVLQYLTRNLEQVMADASQTDLEKGLRVCDVTQMWALCFFSNEASRTGEQIKLALQFMDPLFQVIKGDLKNLSYLMEIRRTSQRLYTHCLNVCLLGLAFTSFLGWDRDKIRWFGVGALVHDIGMIRTPRAILDKKGRLAEDEMSKVKRHPVDGFRMLQDLVYIRWEALQMVLQHHENGDGTGYPEGLKITAIKPWSRILRILDSYEAMTAERPWRPAMEPKDALWIMRKEESNYFDQSYLKAFVKFLAGSKK